MVDLIKIIVIVSLIGVLFSGYFSVQELSTGTCPTGGCDYIFGIPNCVYGLVMYIIIFVCALLAMRK